MKITLRGYDPDLGQKFMEEAGGLIIGQAESSRRLSEAQATEAYSREHGRAPKAQQLHDWKTAPTPNAARPAMAKAQASTREQFSSQDEFEEALDYWQGHVGPIRAMADRAARSKNSRPE